MLNLIDSFKCGLQRESLKGLKDITEHQEIPDSEMRAHCKLSDLIDEHLCYRIGLVYS